MMSSLWTPIAALLTMWAAPVFAQEPAVPDLSGTWHLRMRTATDARIPVIGTTHVRTTTHLLVHITKDDSGQFKQTQRTCVVDSVPDRSLTRTVLPPSFIEHLPVKTYPITLKAKGDGTWSYDADLLQQYVGYKGEMTNGVVPQDKDHPAVYDWDEDGKPGATVLIDIPLFGHVAIYMLQTNHTLLEGTVRSPDLIKGHTRMLLLGQRTIGADNRMLAANPSLTIGKGHNAFEMMRINNEARCSDIEQRTVKAN